MINGFLMFETDSDKDWFRRLLKRGTVEIGFTKADGSVRIMKCTLDPGIIQQHTTLDLDRENKKSETAQTVFDLEKLAWRAFRWDSIKSITFTL